MALGRHGVEVVDGQATANLARVIKSPGEVAVMTAAIASGGEWFETRLLTSGPRTNPWYQECSDRIIEAGDLVALDTDFVGIGGYTVDISRTWLVGDRTATGEQRRLFDAARAQIRGTIGCLQPGISFAELASRAPMLEPALHSPANACVVHGVGLCNEYPLVVNRELFATGGYSGVIEAGMTLCVESLAAPVGGREAAKLEEQVLVTDDGVEVLSGFPFDERLAG